LEIQLDEPTSVSHSQLHKYGDIWLDRGYQYFLRGNFQKALESYDHALQYEPNVYQAWYYRGSALVSLERYEEAISSYDKAIQINPFAYEIWENRGDALINLSHHEKAVTSFEQAIQLQHHDDYRWHSWHHRGYCLDHLDRYEEAIVSYDMALEFQPEDYGIWRDRGRALMSLNQCEESVVSFDKALQLNGNDFYSWEFRGYALYVLERHTEAIKSCDKAIQLQPDDYYSWHNRGHSLSKLGRYEEAVASYDKALQLKIDDYIAWDNRGEAVLSAGEQSIPAVTPPQESQLATSSNLFDPKLQVRGYSGQIMTLETGLTHVPQHSEGWVGLQTAIGKAHFLEGKQQQKKGEAPETYWQKARYHLDQALSVSEFPKERLLALQEIVQLLLLQGEIAVAQAYYQEAMALYQTLIDQAPSPLLKWQLEADCSELNQIVIDAQQEAN
jgi:tetratricopeptide (TPR) repeat protein